MDNYYNQAILEQALNNAQQLAQQQMQMEHDEDMADLNYFYGIHTMNHSSGLSQGLMAQQNAYQVAQWHRENAYNDPRAVRQRYEAAGINAAAAFGQGAASGAGISGGLSGAPSGGAPSGGSYGHSSNIMFRPAQRDIRGAVSMASLESEIKLRDSQARLNDAEARAIEDKIPSTGRTGDSHKAVLDSEVLLNESLRELNDARKKESISNAGYIDSKRALTYAQTTSQNMKNAYDVATYQDRVDSAHYSFLQAKQTYDHNEDKHPLVIQDLRLNLVTQTMNLITMEIQQRLAESNIIVNQAQILNYIAQSSKLTTEAKAITARVEMEKSMQGWKKATMVIDSASNFITAVTRAGSAIATMGASEVGKSSLPATVNGQDTEDFLMTLSGF